MKAKDVGAPVVIEEISGFLGDMTIIKEKCKRLYLPDCLRVRRQRPNNILQKIIRSRG